MKRFRHLDEIPADFHGGAVAIGNFDGVHQGHADLVRRLIQQARKLGGPALVFTFDPHPIELLRPGSTPPALTTTAAKCDFLAALGADATLVYPTDLALLELSAEAFFDEIVCRRLGAKGMTEGDNFRFGRQRKGDVALLAELCRAAGIMLDVVTPIEIDGVAVSSSSIREALLRGDVAQANRMLGRHYRLQGQVVRGAGRGRGIGFPTANVGGVVTLSPGKGVYAGWARCQGRLYAAAINLGPNPTFGEDAIKIEAHLLDATETLYDAAIEVGFVARLREIRPFDGVAALKAQLERDVAETRRLLAPVLVELNAQGMRLAGEG